MTSNPVRTLGWFLLGVSIGGILHAGLYREPGDRKNFPLKRTVAENELNHAILRNIKFHLATRKMSVWDASP